MSDLKATGDKPMVTQRAREAEIGYRMMVMVPRPVGLVITDADKQAACDLIGNDTYGKPIWTIDTISPENRVVQAFARHRAQETLSPEQPLDTIQRLGQEFDAPEATPSLGMGENERAALVRAAEFLDSCAGADIEVDGVTAISVVEELHSLLPETWDDCFHVEAARYLEHLTSPSPDVGLAEENERLREALEEELRDAADTFEKLAASMREEDADLMAPEIAVCEMQRSRIRATLQSISTANGGPGRDGGEQAA